MQRSGLNLILWKLLHVQKRIVRGLHSAEDIGDLAAGKHDCVVCPAGPPVLTATLYHAQPEASYLIDEPA